MNILDRKKNEIYKRCEEPRQNIGQGLVDRTQVEVPKYFIDGRPKAALLFWFFSGFICDVWLFIVLLLRYKIENR